LQIGKAQPRRNREGDFMFLGMMFVAAAAMAASSWPILSPQAGFSARPPLPSLAHSHTTSRKH